MSLQALADLRRSGVKPSGPIKVVVGKLVPAVDGYADIVAVPADAQPQHMDWRPLIGLPAVLLVCNGATPLAERVFDSMVAAKCSPIGAAWNDAVVTSDEPTKPVLRRMWEVLCL